MIKTQTNQEKGPLGFTARLTVVHVVTYFLFGAFFAIIQNREAMYASQAVPFMRPITDILVIAGPLFQLIRGPVIALTLYPIRDTLFNKEKGWLILWGLFLGLAVIGPVGPAPGSIEGLVYTIVPLELSISGWPEALSQTLAFSYIAYLWENNPGNRKIKIPLLAVFGLTIILSTLGILFS